MKFVIAFTISSKIMNWKYCLTCCELGYGFLSYTMAFLLLFLSIVNVIFIHSCIHIVALMKFTIWKELFITWSSSEVQFLNTFGTKSKSVSF